MDAARARLRTLEGRGGAGEGPLGQALLTTEAPAVGVLMALAGVLPPDVRLDRITLTYGRELALEMGVIARDPRAFDRLLERLDSFPLLRDVRPGAENRAGEVRTIVRATWSTHP
jgi:Tfp pilus assembly protein PilN